MRKQSRKLYGIDADRVAPRLYQGSKPPMGPAVKFAGFDALVLCAEEYQPTAEAFPGVRVHHVPLDDHLRPLSEREWKSIIGAAGFAAHHARRGRRVLVTCQMGLNRSGIVSATALMMLAGIGAREAIFLVKSNRAGSLSNSSFVEQLSRLSHHGAGVSIA